MPLYSQDQRGEHCHSPERRVNACARVFYVYCYASRVESVERSERKKQGSWQMKGRLKGILKLLSLPYPGIGLSLRLLASVHLLFFFLSAFWLEPRS